MKPIRTWLVAALVAAGAATAHADGFTADQLRLGEAYRRGADPVAAIAPLLNVVRRGRGAGETEYLAAKLALADSYVTLGLYRSAERLLDSLEPEASVPAIKVDETRLRLAIRRGHAGGIMRALAQAQTIADTPLDPGLLFSAAAAVFATRSTDTPVREVEDLFLTDQRPEALYLLGVCALMRSDPATAYDRFRRALEGIDRRTHPDLYDASALALGRFYYEKGDYLAAETHYAMVSERSALFDRSLYETAWVYMAQGDVTAASGNLMRLAIDFPFSPLVPKSQVLFGFLMLRQGRFAQAERVFSAYIAHYSSMTEALAELESEKDGVALYERVFADLGRNIAVGRNASVEIMSWLDKNSRVREANALIAKLQRAESELADLTRVLREVQSVAEAGYVQEAGTGAADDEAADLRARLDAGALKAARRLKGRHAAAFRKVQREVAEARKMRAGLVRLHRRILEKRREMVSLLQYADAARWSIWNDDGKLHAGTVTAPAQFDQQRAERGFARLDEGERRLLDTLEVVSRLEQRALEARHDLVAAAMRPSGRERAAAALQAWEAAVSGEGTARSEEVTRRLARAALARSQVKRQLETMTGLRDQLLLLSRDAVSQRGRIAREELAEIERAVGSLLVHARLGNADVAWEMRAYARQRAASVARSEQADVEALREFYASLRKPPPQAAAAAEKVTGSTAQRIAVLRRRADADAAALMTAGDVLSRQAAASRALIERLRDGEALGVWMPRVEAAGVLVLGPSAGAGWQPVSASVAVDGRLMPAETADVLIDDYLPPGLHQFDAVVRAKNSAGEPVRLHGTLVVNLEAARGYRLRLQPAGTRAAPRLDILVEPEAAP